MIWPLFKGKHIGGDQLVPLFFTRLFPLMYVVGQIGFRFQLSRTFFLSVYSMMVFICKKVDIDNFFFLISVTINKCAIKSSLSDPIHIRVISYQLAYRIMDQCKVIYDIFRGGFQYLMYSYLIMPHI